LGWCWPSKKSEDEAEESWWNMETSYRNIYSVFTVSRKGKLFLALDTQTGISLDSKDLNVGQIHEFINNITPPTMFKCVFTSSEDLECKMIEVEPEGAIHIRTTNSSFSWVLLNAKKEPLLKSYIVPYDSVSNVYFSSGENLRFDIVFRTN